MTEPNLFGEDIANDISKWKVPFEPFIPTQLQTFDFMVTWGEFVADRKERKYPLTTRAAKMLLKTLSERPKEAEAALVMAIKRAWRGFEWEWLDNTKPEKEKPRTGLQKSKAMGIG